MNSGTEQAAWSAARQAYYDAIRAWVRKDYKEVVKSLVIAQEWTAHLIKLYESYG